MATANFEIGNKEFEVRFIRESGYPPTKNERGSSLVEYDVTIYKDNQPMIKGSIKRNEFISTLRAMFTRISIATRCGLIFIRQVNGHGSKD